MRKSQTITYSVVFDFSYKVCEQQDDRQEKRYLDTDIYNDEVPETKIRIDCFVPPEIRDSSFAFIYELEYFDNVENRMIYLSPFEVKEGFKRVSFMFDDSDRALYERPFSKTFRLLVHKMSLTGERELIRKSNRFLLDFHFGGNTNVD